MHITGYFRGSALASAALLTIAAGCGPADDDADAGQSADITNVDPIEAVPAEKPPEFGEPPTEGSERRHALDPRQADEQVLLPPEIDIYADATIEPASDSGVSGDLRFHQEGDSMQITGMLRGLEPGEHGLHIHVVGDCSAPDASSAQGHFAPDDDPHGSPASVDDRHHVGDLGNIVADENGVAEVEKTDAEMTLKPGDYAILGRAAVIHAGPDDMASQPSGDAGDRIGCGVVELDVEPAYGDV